MSAFESGYDNIHTHTHIHACKHTNTFWYALNKMVMIKKGPSQSWTESSMQILDWIFKYYIITL